jgi:NhaC family Na+:H+ antiporter
MTPDAATHTGTGNQPDGSARAGATAGTVEEGLPPAAPTRDGKPTGLLFATVTLVAIVVVLGVGLLAWDAPLPLMMVAGFCVALAAAVLRGVSYAAAERAALDMIRRGLQCVLIFVAVGALIAAWILSGTVPTMIYLGVNIIEPSVFLPTAILLCALTSFVNGTNFGTVATIGLALMGVASALGVPAGVAAGAIVSGAIFGDKMSPVSDTNILASGLGGVRLVDHIRHMMWTTIPAFLVTLAIFAVVGLRYDGGSAAGRIAEVSTVLEGGFTIGWLPLVPPVLVFGLLLARFEAFPSLVAGVVAGVLVATLYQGVDLTTSLVALWEGYVPSPDQAEAAALLGGGETGGALKLLGLSAIVIFALAIAGALAAAGVMQAFLTALEPTCRTPRRLVPVTLLLSAVLNVVGGAVNFAVAMTTTMLRPLYDAQGLPRRNLTRAAEDAGTTTGPLIPWNATGVFTAASLGVSVTTYAPWALFCFITPLVSLIYGLTGFTITRGPASSRDEEPAGA